MAKEGDLLSKFQQTQMQKEMEFGELISTAITSTTENNVSLAFISVILAIFVVVIFFSKTYWGRWLSSSATTVLPSIGILGTFIGVFISLLNFDANNMEGSMTLIIGGLKVAFVTSIFGLLTGIIVKIVQSKSNSEDIPEGVGAEEILTELQFSRKEAEKQNKNLINAITSDADSSLNTQMKLMRSDLNDFAKTVAEANTTAFIDALKAAIADFNKNLTEQFGENFKRLNEAVGKLLEWQENNKQDMEHMRNSINTAIEGIDKTESSLSNIKESAESIPETVSGLTGILEVIQAQIKDMENHLQAFADVSDQAKDAIPKIEEVLTNYTDGLEKTSDEILSNLTENLKAQEGVYEELQTNFKTVFDDFGQLGTNLQATITEISETLSSKTEEISLNISTTTSNILENFTTSAENSMQTIGNNLEETSNTILTNLSELTAAQNEKSLNIIDEFTSVTEGTINNFKDASDEVIKNATEVTTEHTRATRDIASKLSEQVDTIGTQLRAKLEETVSQLSDTFENALKETQDKQSTQISSFTEELTEQYNKSVSDINSFTQDSLNNTKENLDKILNDELNAFSDRLGSIALRMSDQFGELSDAFAKAIKAAKDLEDK